MEPIILASESPRRKEFFKILGLPFTSVPSMAEEDFEENLEPCAVAEELAIRKVSKVVKALKNESPLWVCGADTLISLEGRIYGKPRDREDAGAMLLAFQGRTHQVISAVALYNGRTKNTTCRSVSSSVTFAPMTSAEIEWYLDFEEWRGAAGSYKLQGIGSCFISEMSGSYSSVVGLPLREFYVMLKDNGYPYGG
jgi:septum formation protein